MKEKGAYVLYLDVRRPLKLAAGSLKSIFLPPGRYAYVGSARAGIEARVLRHKRLAEEKTGKIHWHIDYLLAHPLIQWAGSTALAGENECDVSHEFASRKGVTTPVLKFGSTDCRRRCKAHLYRLGPIPANRERQYEGYCGPSIATVSRRTSQVSRQRIQDVGRATCDVRRKT